MVHVSAWPSIFTGTAPDKHGLYHAYVMSPGQQGPVRPRPDRSPFPFLWKLLSDHGKRCVIMDAFLTCPLQGFNGSQIVDWGSWSHFWETTIISRHAETGIGKDDSDVIPPRTIARWAWFRRLIFRVFISASCPAWPRKQRW